MALGARRKQVLRAALGRAFVLLSAGSAAGLVLGGVLVTMLLLGLVAAWIPAQKALAVNPTILMREE